MSVEKRGINKEEADRLKKEVIEGLRMHFVFNALNVIRYLVHNDQEKAYVALYDLAQFMRGNIESIITGGEISLKDEMIFVHSYINLELLQRKGLTVEWHMQEMEGYVRCGSIGAAISELLKSEHEACKNGKTLSVEEFTNEKVIKIFVAETGRMIEVPVSRRDAKIQNEDNTGR